MCMRTVHEQSGICQKPRAHLTHLGTGMVWTSRSLYLPLVHFFCAWHMGSFKTFCSFERQAGLPKASSTQLRNDALEIAPGRIDNRQRDTASPHSCKNTHMKSHASVSLKDREKKDETENRSLGPQRSEHSEGRETGDFFFETQTRQGILFVSDLPRERSRPIG